MTLSVRQLIEEQAAQLVGRDAEMAVLRQVLGKGGPLVVFVHGIAGVGKSALAHAFEREARSDGATVLRLDCRSIEPTERGFLAALEAKTGGELSSAEDAAARLATLGGRVVLVLDTYELLRLADAWLRQTFLPALSDNVRIVLSGREPPMTGWAGTLGGLFADLPLGNVGRAEAELILRQAGVDDDGADRIYRIARGHPLSLRLAASAIAGRPDVSLETVTVKAIVEGLTELYLGVLDAKTREALDAASVVRRTTSSLLGGHAPRHRPRRTPSTGSASSRSSRSATTGSCCTTRFARRSPRCSDRPIRIDPGGIGRRPGGSFATRSPVRRTTRCGAIPPICCTSCRTRSSGRRSSRRRTTCTPLRPPDLTTVRRSPRSGAPTCRPARRS